MTCSNILQEDYSYRDVRDGLEGEKKEKLKYQLGKSLEPSCKSYRFLSWHCGDKETELGDAAEIISRYRLGVGGREKKGFEMMSKFKLEGQETGEPTNRNREFK